MMQIDIRVLKPNPHRDFKIDPLDKDKIDELVASIKKIGFITPLIGRKDPEVGFQIAYGHHRLEAAKKAGVKFIEFIPGDFDDEEMAHMMNSENGIGGTGSGMKDTTLRNTIVAATTELAKHILKAEKHSDLRADIKKLIKNQTGFTQVKGRMMGGQAVGQPLVTAYMRGTVNKNLIDHGMKLFKSDEAAIGLAFDRAQRHLELEAEHEEAARQAAEDAKEAKRKAKAKAREKAKAAAEEKEEQEQRATEAREEAAWAVEQKKNDPLADVKQAFAEWAEAERIYRNKTVKLRRAFQEIPAGVDASEVDAFMARIDMQQIAQSTAALAEMMNERKPQPKGNGHDIKIIDVTAN